ncbi:hypothetical protein J6590_002309 [Homalodisca vitripennis]|nr:hypothetical protein J6590_002309 [Homalodisca vitripennis]
MNDIVVSKVMTVLELAVAELAAISWSDSALQPEVTLQVVLVSVQSTALRAGKSLCIWDTTFP